MHLCSPRAHPPAGCTIFLSISILRQALISHVVSSHAPLPPILRERDEELDCIVAGSDQALHHTPPHSGDGQWTTARRTLCELLPWHSVPTIISSDPALVLHDLSKQLHKHKDHPWRPPSPPDLALAKDDRSPAMTTTT